ncbi:MAG: tyrosine-protein phosphatase [Phycisphaerae bacterium]|nr:tyrosine-protein phosphatase [Phycisphaerae bacterium]
MVNSDAAKTVSFSRGKRIAILLAVVIVGVVAYGVHSFRNETGSFSANDKRDLPAEKASGRLWATPLELAGVPNYHKVSDGLYRGAQPTSEGMANLKESGIKTIVNLRKFHSDRDEMGEWTPGYEHIKMAAWHAEREDIVRFLKIVNDPDQQPVFVHCLHGADRTGTMCAIYRVVMEGWSKEDALKEMTRGGFNFHETWKNLMEFVDQLDVEAIKKEVADSAH